MALILSAVFFFIFTASVVMGAWSGAPLLGDIGQMLVLFAAVLCFVVAVLRREAKAAADPNNRE